MRCVEVEVREREGERKETESRRVLRFSLSSLFVSSSLKNTNPHPLDLPDLDLLLALFHHLVRHRSEREPGGLKRGKTDATRRRKKSFSLCRYRSMDSSTAAGKTGFLPAASHALCLFFVRSRAPGSARGRGGLSPLCANSKTENRARVSPLLLSKKEKNSTRRRRRRRVSSKERVRSEASTFFRFFFHFFQGDACER